MSRSFSRILRAGAWAIGVPLAVLALMALMLILAILSESVARRLGFSHFAGIGGAMLFVLAAIGLGLGLWVERDRPRPSEDGRAAR